MKKDQFIKKLTEFSREDIQNFIEKNGKPPKLIRLFTPLKKELREEKGGNGNGN